MKLLRGMAIAATGIYMAAMMSACQTGNETALNPQTPATISDRNAKTADILLIKDGGKDLAYATVGRPVLWKEIDQSLNSFWEFTYTAQNVTATKYNQTTKQQMDVDLYTLDANGLCTQSSTDKVFNYEYNVNGQLTKCYNKFEPNERQEFAYENDPAAQTKSLSKVTFYDKFNIKKREITYSYTAGGVIPDLNPMNPECLPTNGRKYLPIFGKFNTNLAKLVTDNTFLSSGTKLMTAFLYEYALDADGRANTVTLKKTDGTIISVTQRKYSSPVGGI